MDASDIFDLAEAYAIFCEDNCIPQDTVTYIEAAEQEIKPSDHLYVLISVEDNSIQDPDYFLDKESARKAMKEAFDKVKDIDDAQIHDDYPCVQGYYTEYDEGSCANLVSMNIVRGPARTDRLIVYCFTGRRFPWISQQATALT